MIVKQYDTVLLKDGREAAVVEAYENKSFRVRHRKQPKGLGDYNSNY